MEKVKIIALFGESASGKDTIQKYIVSSWPDICSGIVSCTTRPKRDYEIDGVDYYFLNNIQFAEKVMNGDMLEATSFNDWFYGTPYSSLNKEKINVGVFNPAGMKALLADDRVDVIPIYVYASNKTRLLRSLSREELPNCYEICRRFMADTADFNEENLDFEYHVLDNNSDLNKSKIEQYILDFNNYCPTRLIKYNKNLK